MGSWRKEITKERDRTGKELGPSGFHGYPGLERGARERSADVTRSIDPGGVPEVLRRRPDRPRWMDGWQASDKWHMRARAAAPREWSLGPPADASTLV